MRRFQSPRRSIDRWQIDHRAVVLPRPSPAAACGRTVRTAKQGRVVFWSGEDGIKDTLLPRFLAAGGNRSNMHFIEGVRDGGRKRPFDPAADMPKLTQTVQRLKDVRLIVLDPIAIAVKGDSHKNVETRVGLQPFADLVHANRRVRPRHPPFHQEHGGRQSARPGDRIAGVSRPAALRPGRGAGPERRAERAAGAHAGEGQQRPGLGRLRLQVGPTRARQLARHRSAARPLGRRHRGSARDILAKFEGKPRCERNQGRRCSSRGARRRAADGGGSYRRGRKAGIAERTLRYAFKSLGGAPERHGKGRGHFIVWELPKETLQ